MGAWGTAISSNDTYADTYRDFFDLYNDGLDAKEISEKLVADSQEIINDREDSNNFWFAIAKARWECKQLDKEILERVRQIIEAGVDLEIWRQLDANEKDLKKRQVALDKFLADLQAERQKAKTRKKKIIRQPVFEKGECLAFKLANGNYGGAVVLEAVKDSEYGHNLIALTRINQPNKPIKGDFESAEVLVDDYAGWDNKPFVKWYLPIRYKKIAHLIDKVDRIEVQLDYDINQYAHGFVGDFIHWFVGVADLQFKSEETELRSTTKLTIRELTWKE